MISAVQQQAIRSNKMTKSRNRNDKKKNVGEHKLMLSSAREKRSAKQINSAEKKNLRNI